MLGIAYAASIGGIATIIGTPPNAIVFGSRCIRISQMARAGLWLNFLGVLLITAFVYLWTRALAAPAGIFNL